MPSQPSGTYIIKLKYKKNHLKTSAIYDNICDIGVISHFGLAFCLGLFTSAHYTRACRTCNRSIIMGIFPNEWKCAKVVPIHKQGKRNCVDNYRPISIIPAVAKVFERLIYDQVFQYITEKKILIKTRSKLSLHFPK